MHSSIDEINAVKIPDHSIYKVTKEGTPELYAYQEKLAREGLKDPWLRNLVWRHQKGPPFLKRFSSIICGIGLGLACFGGFVYVDKNYKCSWHHDHSKEYKLLYQLKDDYKEEPHHHH